MKPTNSNMCTRDKILPSPVMKEEDLISTLITAHLHNSHAVQVLEKTHSRTHTPVMLPDSRVLNGGCDRLVDKASVAVGGPLSQYWCSGSNRSLLEELLLESDDVFVGRGTEVKVHTVLWWCIDFIYLTRSERLSRKWVLFSLKTDTWNCTHTSD